MVQKNILIISSKSADFGGVEYHVLDLIKAFSPNNKVLVFCPQGSLVESYISAGAEVTIKTPSTPFDFKFALYVKEFCLKKNIDIVHAHELISAQGLFGAFMAGVKIRVWHVHTPFLFWKHKNLFTKIVKTIPNWIVNFIVANIFSTDVVALTEGIKKHRRYFEFVFRPIHVIPNAVDTRFFSQKFEKNKIDTKKKSLNIPLNRTIIGNMSRTSVEKGQNILLKSFNAINTRYPNKYFLLIAGGGELESEYRKYCEANFKDSYLITGKFSNIQKLSLLKIMDLFVFPSLAEGFGYVLVESIACKIPVVASNIEVLKKVGGENIYYFKSGDSGELTKVLDMVLNMDNNKRIKNVEKAYNKIQEYSFENFIKNYSYIYKI